MGDMSNQRLHYMQDLLYFRDHGTVPKAAAPTDGESIEESFNRRARSLGLPPPHVGPLGSDHNFRYDFQEIEVPEAEFNEQRRYYSVILLLTYVFALKLVHFIWAAFKNVAFTAKEVMMIECDNNVTNSTTQLDNSTFAISKIH